MQAARDAPFKVTQPCQRFINIAGNTLSFPCRQQNQSVVDWLDSLIDLIEVQVQSNV